MCCLITLSNGATIQENGTQVDWWRKTLNYCNRNNLTIRSIIVDNEVISPRADAYFILRDTIAFCGGKSYTRKGYGIIQRANNKARIIWFNEDGQKLFSEVIKPYPAWYEEISVNREKISPQ